MCAGVGVASAQDDGAEFGASAEVDPEGEARSRVTRRHVEERLPTSTPDALRWEPGVYIQQTSHGQASPFVRGLTGQQVVHVFDGVRMNNGIYRSGPNQYFFSVDPRTIGQLEVVQGSASTRWGSDAVGGAVLATPLEPWLDDEDYEGDEVHPRLFTRFGSASLEYGARAEVEARVGRDTALLVGAGYRDVDLLVSGGVVDHLDEASTGPPPVPRFEEEATSTNPDDWSTQLGTGFNELTFDGRVVRRLSKRLRVTGALYGYRQADAPRTDRCPRPGSEPGEDCLTITHQDRTLGYVALRGDAGRELRDVELIASVQNQREERVRDRPANDTRFNLQEDDVTTLGAAFRASTRRFALGDEATWKLRYGAEAYRDGLASTAEDRDDADAPTVPRSRGRYIDGSSYVRIGGFSEAEIEPYEWLVVRGGARISAVGARVPPDRVTGSRTVSREFGAVVGRGGVELRPTEGLSLLLNVDQGFRAPNLDDLTSRQQTGSSFQIENADLGPERALTYELGAKSDLEWIRFDAWLFATFLTDALQRRSRDPADCPPGTPECAAADERSQLINADDTSLIFGAAGGATVQLPKHVAVRATLSYARGEGPNTDSRPGDPAFGEARVPLSRIPPFNGTLEVRWNDVSTGIYTAAAVRWALAQRRLAPRDVNDARIPDGGTPGYALFDVRAGLRLADRLRLSLVFENLLDTAWRAHGSSVNGAGRGLIAEAMVGF